jgi:hypothetical protein
MVEGGPLNLRKNWICVMGLLWDQGKNKNPNNSTNLLTRVGVE